MGKKKGYNYAFGVPMLTPRVPASEKPDEELFFVQKDIADDSAVQRRTRKELRSKPLKSEINLKSSSCLVDSSDDEEFDRSISYRSISEEQRARLAAREKKCPEKVTVHMAGKDLWDDGMDIRYFVRVVNVDHTTEPEEVPLNDEHYLKVTRKCKVKVTSTQRYGYYHPDQTLVFRNLRQ